MPIRKLPVKIILLTLACVTQSIPVLASPTPEEITLRSNAAIELQRQANIELPWQHLNKTNELLERREYEQYEAMLKRYLTAWKDDPFREYSQHLLFELIDSQNPNLLHRLDEWITKNPSAIAFLARGAYLTKRGEILRGSAPTSATPALNLKILAVVHLRAKADLQQAIRLDPELLPAYTNLLVVAKLSPDLKIDADKVLAMATRHYPFNVQARRRYLDTISPDWGGSFNAMETFTQTLDTPAETNALLWTLKAQVHYEKAESLPQSELNQKIIELTTALRYANFNKYLESRAFSYLAQKKYGEAIADLERCALTEDQRLKDSEPPTNYCKMHLEAAKRSARDYAETMQLVKPPVTRGENK